MGDILNTIHDNLKIIFLQFIFKNYYAKCKKRSQLQKFALFYFVLSKKEYRTVDDSKLNLQHTNKQIYHQHYNRVIKEDFLNFNCKFNSKLFYKDEEYKKKKLKI